MVGPRPYQPLPLRGPCIQNEVNPRIMFLQTDLIRACLYGGGGPQVAEVICGGSTHLSWKRDQIKMRDYKRVSMRWWLLRLLAYVLALLRLSVNLFQLRWTKKLKINVFCFNQLNINKPVFFCIFKQNKGLRIISGWNRVFFWKIVTSDWSYFQVFHFSYYFTQPRPQGAFPSKATEKRPGDEVVFYS